GLFPVLQRRGAFFVGKSLRKLTGLVAALSIFMGMDVVAADVGNLTWTTTDGKVTITLCDGAATGELVIPDTIGGVPVTSIGNYAFNGCTSLTSVTIGNGVTSIGDYAFNGCTSLTSITIPDGVTSIGNGAFSNCTSLTTIEVGAENVNYSDVNGVLFNKEKTLLHTYPAGKTGDNYTIPDSVTSIGRRVFYNCTSLTSITIGNGVTSIGDFAFNGCSSLTSITIPDSVTSLGESAFWGCTSLTSITIGDGVTSISEFTFYNCISLTSITIPDSVTSIGINAFLDCTNLTSITFQGAAPTVAGNTFNGVTAGALVTSENQASFGDIGTAWNGLTIALVETTASVANAAPVAVAQSVITDEDTALAITLAGTDADPYSNTVLDQSHAINVGSFDNPNTAQSFTAGQSGELDKVELYLSGVGISSATVTIREGSGTSGNILDTQTVTGITDADWYTVNTEGVTVTAGNEYTIHVTHSGDWDFTSISWYRDSGNPSYAGGRSYYSNEPYSEFDLSFKTYVKEPLVYVPNANYNGTDSFTFKVNDGLVDSTTATVSITVNAINDAPVAVAQSGLITDEDTSLAITLAGTDADTDSLSFTVVAQPVNGTLSGTAPDLIYTPSANYNGADSFTFKVNDTTVDSNTATVSIMVNPVNYPPVVVSELPDITATEDGPDVLIDLGPIFQDDDPADDSAMSYVVTENTNGAMVTTSVNTDVFVLKGSYRNGGGYAGEVVVDGNYAYVADGQQGLTVVNVGDPESPTLAGNYDPSWDIGDVAISGGYAYLANQSGGVRVVSIADPSNPTEVAQYNTAGSARGIDVSGNYAYVADGSGLVILDVSNPSAPVLVGTSNTPDFAYRVDVEGGYAYVADRAGGLQIVDISDPSSPQIVGSYSTQAGSNWSTGAAWDVKVEGGYAYVAASGAGLIIVDVSNPANPVLEGSYSTNVGDARGVYVLSGKAYLAASSSGLLVIDVTSPSSPVLVGILSLIFLIKKFKING
ncbi:leucine-rich repeat protein, partial [Akkermansiaceae bacterium]|nr:leucine-rich repeat protein [Akkermansiaceae bacterium]